MTKKRALPPERLAECQQLNKLYLAKKNSLGLSMQSIADAAEITPVAVAHYLKGTNPLNMTFVAVMARLLREPVAAFSPRLAKEMAGIAQVMYSVPSEPLQPDGHCSEVTKWVPLLAGVLEQLTVGRDTASIELYVCSDDSMRPAMSAGDVLVVDRSVTDVDGEGVYKASYVGGIYTRRFQRVLNGGYLMLSDNPNYHATFIDPRSQPALVIEGKVVGVLKAFRY